MPNTIAENLTRLQTARTNIATAITGKGGTVASGAGLEDFPTAIGTIPSGSATLITKNITANGTYNASSDNADGYSSVTVSVPSGGSSGDTVITTRSKGFVPNNNVDWIDVNWDVGNTTYGNNSFFVGDDFYVVGNLNNGGTYYKFTPNSQYPWAPVSSLHVTSILSDGCFWSDGTDIYASAESVQLVLDKTNLTWNTKTWTGLTNPSGQYVWTDGTDIFYSDRTKQYVLDKSTSTWSAKTWTGFNNIRGNHIWTDGTNVYYSYNSDQYVLDKSTSTWSAKTWTGLTTFSGEHTWTDGNSIYYSNGANQYVLDKATSTWSAKTWTGLSDPIGKYVCYNGSYICYIVQGTSSSTATYRMLRNTKRLQY